MYLRETQVNVLRGMWQFQFYHSFYNKFYHKFYHKLLPLTTTLIWESISTTTPIFADKIGKISDFQHAYSGSKGTDTALSTLVNLIESAILRKQLCLVISVDIQGAFDNLAFMAIEKVMKDNNYPPLMIRWFMNVLKNRISIAEVLGVKLSIRPVCGTPQGGVLSSRIWNLAFDPLLKLLMMEPYVSGALTQKH